MVEPVAVWIERERFEGRMVKCLTVILRTRGCSWNRCLMCGYKKDTDKDIRVSDLINQLESALRRFNGPEVLKIFTSGSFFELEEEFRRYVYRRVEELGFRKLIVESRPEFIGDVVDEIRNLKFRVEVGIGLETSNDFIREYCINKGFRFKDFMRSAELLKSNGIGVKVYLLLKPPFLSEREAIEDVLRSVEDVREIADVISLNPTNVQSGTYLEKLWIRGLYRPPWLWSVVKVLKEVEGVEIISDPVGAGSPRGPHNCGKCDRMVANAIKKFSLTQDKSVFDELKCKCLKIWEKVLELESYSRTPLFS